MCKEAIIKSTYPYVLFIGVARLNGRESIYFNMLKGVNEGDSFNRLVFTVYKDEIRVKRSQNVISMPKACHDICWFLKEETLQNAMIKQNATN